MAEAQKPQVNTEETTEMTKKTDMNAMSPKEAMKDMRIRQRKGFRKDSKPRSRKGKDDAFDSRIISIRRVTRVYKGGKRMRLSVVSVVGDKKGRVGIGIGKGADVKTAEEKAVTYAKKHLVNIVTKGDTIPHQIVIKKGAARIFMKPAAPGTGIIAGSSIRSVVEMAGIKDILTKVIGSRNSVSNAYTAIEALSLLRTTRI